MDYSVLSLLHTQDHPYSIFRTLGSSPNMGVSHLTEQEVPIHTLLSQSETSHAPLDASRVLFNCSKNSGFNTFCELRGTGTGNECNVPSVRRWNLCGLV